MNFGILTPENKMAAYRISIVFICFAALVIDMNPKSVNLI